MEHCWVGELNELNWYGLKGQIISRRFHRCPVTLKGYLPKTVNALRAIMTIWYKNNHKRHQKLKFVTNTFGPQHASPTCTSQKSSKPLPIWQCQSLQSTSNLTQEGQGIRKVMLVGGKLFTKLFDADLEIDSIWWKIRISRPFWNHEIRIYVRSRFFVFQIINQLCS